MPDEDAQSDLLVEAMKLLQKFQPGGKSGAIANRDEWEKQVQSHASQDRELLQELTRFGDLWRYFQEKKEKLGPTILSVLKELPKLEAPERIQRIREINQKLMERIPDAGEGLKFRN